MKSRILSLLLPLLAALFPAGSSTAQVPNLLSQQGRVAVNGVNFDGTGQFKFALVNGAGTISYWSNDGTSAAGSQPTAAVSLPVTKGLYSVQLGDTALPNMTAVPASVLSNGDLRVRVWFNNGALGFQQLTPDQRLAPNGYLPDGAVTSAKLADGAVTSAKLTPGATPSPVLVTGATQNAAANTEYAATGSGTTTFVLPATAAPGDRITVNSGALGGVSVYDPALWTARESQRPWTATACSADGTRIIAAATNQPLYLSTDAGVTWTTGENARNWNAVASSADGTRLVAAEFVGRIHTSQDSGLTWTPQGDNRIWMAVASSADGMRLIAATQQEQLYTSADAGVTWTPRESNRYWRGVASSADGMKLTAVAEGDRIYTSVDAGVTWTPRDSVRSWWAVASSADGTRLTAAVINEQIYTSTDSGATWTPRESNRTWTALASSADGSRLLASTYPGRLYISTDAGVTWTPRESSRYWGAVASSADGSRLLAAALNGGFLYTSGGVTYAAPPNTTVQLTYTSAGWMPLKTTGLWTQTGGKLTYNEGHVGIGTADPPSPLSMGSSVGNTKIALWESGPGIPSYGLGIQPSEFRFHLAGPAARFTFLNLAESGPLMTILGNGRVGIGTTSPAGLLDVNTGAGRAQIRNEQDLAVGLKITGGPMPGHLRFRHALEIWPDDTRTEPGHLDVRDKDGNPTITLDGGTASIGIGRPAEANRLEVEGDASKATAGAWLANSDRRIKTDITPVTNALATLDKVNPVTFRYTDEYRKAHPDIKDVPYYNVIAQEFREVFPNAVKSSGEKLPDGTEILQVDTYPATVTALAAIKELKAENEALRQRLAALEELVRKVQPTGTGGNP